MATRKLLVADFAGERAEAVAFCEAHPGFEIVEDEALPEGQRRGASEEESAEFLSIAIDCGDDEHGESAQAYARFEELGWDAYSVWTLNKEVEDDGDED